MKINDSTPAASQQFKRTYRKIVDDDNALSKHNIENQTKIHPATPEISIETTNTNENNIINTTMMNNTTNPTQTNEEIMYNHLPSTDNERGDAKRYFRKNFQRMTHRYAPSYADRIWVAILLGTLLSGTLLISQPAMAPLNVAVQRQSIQDENVELLRAERFYVQGAGDRRTEGRKEDVTKGEEEECILRVPLRTAWPLPTVQLTVFKSETDYFDEEIPACSAGSVVQVDGLQLQTWHVPWEVWLMRNESHIDFGNKRYFYAKTINGQVAVNRQTGGEIDDNEAQTGQAFHPTICTNHRCYDSTEMSASSEQHKLDDEEAPFGGEDSESQEISVGVSKGTRSYFNHCHFRK